MSSIDYDDGDNEDVSYEDKDEIQGQKNHEVLKNSTNLPDSKNLEENHYNSTNLPDLEENSIEFEDIKDYGDEYEEEDNNFETSKSDNFSHKLTNFMVMTSILSVTLIKYFV